MSYAYLLLGDVRDQLATIPDGSVDLVLTSPPFLALRSYLPDDHPDKWREIGSEPDPATFIDTMLDLAVECRRVLAPHGSLVFEFGDTYAGSGGAGGDYDENGQRDGQPRPAGSAKQRRNADDFPNRDDNPRPSRAGRVTQSNLDGSARRGDGRAGGEDGQPTIPGRKHYTVRKADPPRRTRTNNLYAASPRGNFAAGGANTSGDPMPGIPVTGGMGWPLAKSLCGIPHLFHLSLSYGRNVLREPVSAEQVLWWIDELVAGGMDPRQAIAHAGSFVAERGDQPQHYVEPWLVRNVVAWCRPNPPVGALGDKFRPGTSYLTVATPSPRRYFDLTAVRKINPRTNYADDSLRGRVDKREAARAAVGLSSGNGFTQMNPAGTPPLDHWWHEDEDVFDEDAWLISGQPYRGSHYATWPQSLCVKPIDSMTPLRVCTTCGEPSRRLVEKSLRGIGGTRGEKADALGNTTTMERTLSEVTTTGWSDCGHDTWRRGIVLDPFAGSGTTLAVATGMGRNAVGIDLDERNAALCRERIGMFLQEGPPEWGAPEAGLTAPTVDVGETVQVDDVDDGTLAGV